MTSATPRAPVALVALAVSAAIAIGAAAQAPSPGFVPAPPSDVRPVQPVRARHAMVIAQQPAEDAGIRVLKQGGNAVDAAVAVGFALAVTYPYAGALGGGGFMLIRLADGRTTLVDFRERAPAAASRDMYLDAAGHPTRESLEGWRSSGVPGTVRGFELAQKKYGRLRWADTVAPAIALAARGFAVPPGLAESLESSRALARDAESARTFQRGGAYYAAGERLVQPALADTLGRLARAGAADFYTGETAGRLADAMAAHGGLITRADLAAYTAVERTALVGTYRNYTVIGSPPPSSGGVGLIQMLGMLDGTGYAAGGFGSAPAMHTLAEVMRRFYADRNQYLGDPDFVTNPVAALLDPAYIAARRRSIDPDHATPSRSLGPGLPTAESRDTTHYDVVDADGNAVSVTYTLNAGYGNGITVPGLGFLLNDEMDDFASSPGSPNLFGLVQGEVNAIQPGKRPLSTMSPTIVLRDGRLFMVLGSPGGSHIATAVLQVFLNVVDFGMNVQQAVDAPRLHHQWLPDTLYLEPGFSTQAIDGLKARGHTVSLEPAVVPSCVEAIVVERGSLQGAADPRRWAKAAGY